jgi:hypothetical protein
VDGSDEGTAIAEFWAWWPTIAPALDQGLMAGAVDSTLHEELGSRIRAIHGRLDWGLCPGRRARHGLYVSARGDLALRPVAERWRQEAVEPGDLWEFYAARQPRAGDARELKVGGHVLRLDELTAQWCVDESREVINLVAHHPRFSDLDEPHRAHVTFVALDDLLGEDGVELWLGTVELTTVPPSGARPLNELRAVVVKLEQEATEERWTSRQGDVDGSPVVVTVNRALKCVRHLALDQHARVDIRLLDPNKLGLARGDEALELEKREAELREELGDRAVFIGRETHGGHRVLHLHTANSENVKDRIEAWKRRGPDRETAILIQPDPRWEVLRRWG